MVTLVIKTLLPFGGFDETEDVSNPETVKRVEVPSRSLCRVKLDTRGELSRSCFDAGTG